MPDRILVVHAAKISPGVLPILTFLIIAFPYSIDAVIS